MQGIPAGFPCGMPGIGELIDGAIQHAPHCDLHTILALRSAPANHSSSVPKLTDLRPASGHCYEGPTARFARGCRTAAAL